MSAVLRTIDRFDAIFDHDGLVADVRLVLAGTLIAKLGQEPVIDRWVRTGSANAGRRILTVVAAVMAGATEIDHGDLVRAGAT